MEHGFGFRILGALAAVMIVSFTAQCLGAQPAGATFPGANGRFAITSWPLARDDNSADIVVLDQDGGGRQTILHNGASNQNPAWSPDGSRIAFASDMPGGGGYFDIYVMDADGSHVTSVARRAADERSPVWSPDGSRLAYYSDAPDGSNTDIWIKDLGTGTRTRITMGQYSDMFPDWSPNGRWIAYQSNRRSSAGDTRFHIWIKNVATLAARQISVGRGHQLNPSWSPDGSQIAYERYLSGDENLWTTTLKTGEAVQLTSGAAWAVWSPDGTSIAFLSDHKICTLVIASGQITEVTDAARDGVDYEYVEAWERI